MEHAMAIQEEQGQLKNEKEVNTPNWDNSAPTLGKTSLEQKSFQTWEEFIMYRFLRVQ